MAAGVRRLGYRPALDGVRGVAVLFVVLLHVFGWPRNGGPLGVEIFFVLSGFLITSLLLEEHEATGTISLRSFYGRRALRLFPLLYLFLAIATVTILAAGEETRWYLGSIAAAALYVGNLYGLLAEHTELAPAVGHLWTLAVEEQFYVVWPVVLLVALRRRWQLRRIVVGMGVACIVVRAALLIAGETVWTLPTTYGDALFVGCMLAAVRRDGWLDRLPRLAPLVAILVVLSSFVPEVDLSSFAGLAYLWPVLLGGGLVIVATNEGPRALTWKPLVWLGGISYGLYVSHVPVAVVAERLFPQSHTAVRGSAVLLVSLALSGILRSHYEAIFLRRKPGSRSGSPDLPGPSGA
jgi:peptidoglycan/LPS O-acetylase OafA/YrhL